jgi:HSP20 family protein
MTRTVMHWNPWREMNRVRREMDQLFNYDWRPATWQHHAEFPPINAWENENGLVLSAELPGADASKLDVSLEKDSVTISGERAAEAGQPTAESYVRRERWFEPFKRTFELPFDVNPDKCEATYEKGVLTVRLERSPEQQPKKLTIKAG